jgi:hypothetical protein
MTALASTPVKIPPTADAGTYVPDGSPVSAAEFRTCHALFEAQPAARSLLTWNAVENRHMLAINTLLGFKPAGYEGEWQKRLG